MWFCKILFPVLDGLESLNLRLILMEHDLLKQIQTYQFISTRSYIITKSDGERTGNCAYRPLTAAELPEDIYCFAGSKRTCHITAV